MSLRSLASAAGDSYRSARPATDSGGVATTAGGGEHAAPGTNGLVRKGSDAYWSAMGGPWCANYRRFASLIAIGVGEGEPHREHFTDPFDALEFFRLPQFDRYRDNATLRHECKITYKDSWYMVEPFADDADHAVDVLRDEVARDRASGATT